MRVRSRFSVGKGVLLVALLTGFAESASPTALLQMSMEQMATASTEIVQGTVTRTYTAGSGDTIYTHYVVQVSQRWKGVANPTTDVAVPGGVLNGLRQSFPGVPVLQNGKEYMLFLWQGKKGPNQLVGLSQGVLEVGADASGLMMATRAATGETMLNGAGLKVADQPVHLRLSVLKSRVAAALAVPQSAVRQATVRQATR